MYRSEITIHLGALRRNVRTLRRALDSAELWAVVKADAYGHGAVESARAALAGGADWLGVAEIAEGLALREAGITAPVLAWLHEPDEDFAEAARANLDLGLSSLAQLEAAAAARASDRPVFVQLKVETGLSPMTHVHCAWEYKAQGVTAAQMNLYYGLAVIALDGVAFTEQYREDECTSVIVGAVAFGKIRNRENSVLEDARGIGHPRKVTQPHRR